MSTNKDKEDPMCRTCDKLMKAVEELDRLLDDALEEDARNKRASAARSKLLNDKQSPHGRKR